MLVFLSSLLASGALLAGILLVRAGINPIHAGIFLIRAGTDAMIIRIIDKKHSNHPIKFYTITVVFGFYYKKINFNFLEVQNLLLNLGAN